MGRALFGRVGYRHLAPRPQECGGPTQELVEVNADGGWSCVDTITAAAFDVIELDTAVSLEMADDRREVIRRIDFLATLTALIKLDWNCESAQV